MSHLGKKRRLEAAYLRAQSRGTQYMITLNYKQWIKYLENKAKLNELFCAFLHPTYFYKQECKDVGNGMITFSIHTVYFNSTESLKTKAFQVALVFTVLLCTEHWFIWHRVWKVLNIKTTQNCCSWAAKYCHHTASKPIRRTEKEHLNWNGSSLKIK